MNTQIYKVLVLIFFSFFSSPAFADTKLMLCNGIWTTKACEKPEKSLDGIEYVAPVVKSSDAVPVPEKINNSGQDSVPKTIEEPVKNSKDISALLHPLNMKASEIKNTYNKSFDISQTEMFCKNQKTTVDECSKAVSETLAEARDYELKLEELKLEEKKLEEVTNNPPASGDQNVVSVNQVTTTIEKNTVIKTPPPPVPPQVNKPAKKSVILGDH